MRTKLDKAKKTVEVMEKPKQGIHKKVFRRKNPEGFLYGNRGFALLLVNNEKKW